MKGDVVRLVGGQTGGIGTDFGSAVVGGEVAFAGAGEATAGAATEAPVSGVGVFGQLDQQRVVFGGVGVGVA